MVYEFAKEVRYKKKPYTLLGTVSDVLLQKLVSLIPGRGRYSLRANMKLRLRCYRDSKRIGWGIVRLYPDPEDPGYHKLVP